MVEKTNGGGTKKTVIADFGCGDAKLAEKLLALRIGKDGKTLAQASTKKTASCSPFEVHSFDLVSGGNPLVTPADMSSVPLPDEAVDVAVYSLALMGTNVADFVREAWRVLRFNGVLRVAEVRSRFETASGGTPDEEDETNNKRGKSNNGKRHHPAKFGGGNRANKRNPTDDGVGDAPPQHLMLLDDFPLSGFGKVSKKALAERAADADRDYVDMRRFQARYIEADHARLALIVDVQRLRDALKPFAAIDLTTNQSVDAMDVLRARIDTADHVFHAPTGETWVVKYVRGDNLAWCGWPPGEAKLGDCTLVKKASSVERESLLREMEGK